jgi:hypothetical protein
MPDARDKVATFVADSHLKKIIGRPHDLVVQVEKLIEEAFNFTACLDAEMFTNLVVPIGDLLLRCGLKLVDKEKKWYDGAKRSIDDIKHLYLSDLSNALGHTVEYDPWSAGAPTMVAPTSAKAAPTISKPISDFKSLSDYSDPEAQAKLLGYMVGDFVYEKEFDNLSENWYTIIVVQDRESVILQKAFSYSGSELQRVKLSLDTLMKRWNVVKNPEVPRVISEGQNRPMTVDVDKVRASAYHELLKADKATTKDWSKQGLAIWTNPHMVRSTRAIPAGELVLLPMVPLAHIIATKPKAGSPTQQQICTDPPLFIIPLSKLQLIDGNKQLTSDQLVVAYWLVTGTDKPVECNMVETIIQKGDFAFKALTNSHDIDPFTQLKFMKPAKVECEKRQLSDVTIVDDAAAKRTRVNGKKC